MFSLLPLLLACHQDLKPDDTADSGGNDTDETGDTTDTTDTGDSTDSGDTADSTDTGGSTLESCQRWFPVDLEGATWTYKTPTGGTVYFAAGGAEVWEGVKAQRLDIGGEGPPSVQYFECASEGLRLVGIVRVGDPEDLTLTLDPPVLFLPREVRAGDSWQSPATLTLRGGGTDQVLDVTVSGSFAKPVEVGVPAGTFIGTPFLFQFGAEAVPPIQLALVEDVGAVLAETGLELVSWDFP